MSRRSITPDIERAIRRLHGEHPELGHEGLIRLLEDDDIAVDEYELRKFMDENKMDPGPTATWKWKLLGRRYFPWL
jgi:hypothetical protein